eukprot:CAMPEP_0177263674 /NCGR_PEP_ID=MMETSP0367-20130122/61121_1 /TAXON_ID=447022 ORGANISM="Scrippsiella hangoei-like, Strain SHHI-4" /NCGR_SAMPLE_ID=MMETSP0367 /ASSEMBLY_ACC=CAM_ASM_000362 /LENGTH=37 /DNA_ID= /DNA_START= /DNA_END= /DNA_ORIENTATION=
MKHQGVLLLLTLLWPILPHLKLPGLSQGQRQDPNVRV